MHIDFKTRLVGNDGTRDSHGRESTGILSGLAVMVDTGSAAASRTYIRFAGFRLFHR